MLLPSEQMTEGSRYHCFKLHTFTRYRMGETEDISMQTEPMERVVAVTIFHIATHRMSHISRMYPYLVLPSCL